MNYHFNFILIFSFNFVHFKNIKKFIDYQQHFYDANLLWAVKC